MICYSLESWLADQEITQQQMWLLLNPGVQPRAGNPEVTGIPQVDYSTSQ